VFYAAADQPAIPKELRHEVAGLGRVLGYTPWREAVPPALPREVADDGLTPDAVRTAYNLGPLAAAGYTGKGETIVVYGFGGFRQSDLDSFADRFELPRFTPELLGKQFSTLSDETAMDLEVAHALAPEARLVVANARPSTEGDRTYIKVGDLMANADRTFPGAIWSLSIGWGCDKLLTAADLVPVRSALTSAHAHGTAVFDASGDLAGLECRGGRDWSAPPGADQIGLDSVASLPEVTVVGGTTLSSERGGRWLAESAWFQSVLTLGSGGGTSALFERPSWQQVSGTGDQFRRLTPDVAAVADMFSGVKIVLDGRLVNGGGTSLAAPIWAGVGAVMNQYLQANGGRRLGDFNPLLYRIAQGAPRPAFHDVVRGANAVASAGPGYDQVTGLGTPDVDNLARDVLDLQRTLG
jgi:kumamolisin